jgi:hypothetical protein
LAGGWAGGLGAGPHPRGGGGVGRPCAGEEPYFATILFLILSYVVFDTTFFSTSSSLVL